MITWQRVPPALPKTSHLAVYSHVKSKKVDKMKEIKKSGGQATLVKLRKLKRLEPAAAPARFLGIVPLS